MPRDHIEFVQSQTLSWNTLDAKNARSGADYKLLSEDPLSGATTGIFRYPAGWGTLGCKTYYV